jgi:hypothetical protein
LNSTAVDESLSANQGRVLNEKIAEAQPKPLSTESINSILAAACFPAIITEDE